VNETATSPHLPSATPGMLLRWLHRLIDVDADEVALLAWSWLYFFCILSAYYVIRPIRDDMGIAGGVDNLPWLFTGSLAGMLVANPIFATLVSRMPRRTFITAWNRFFAVNLVLFFVALKFAADTQQVWLGRAFFIWTSVFNMFVVSVFWSVMTDVFSNRQAKRLFGFIGAGGTLGSIAGATLTTMLVGEIGTANLLLASAVLLEIGIFAVRRLLRLAGTRQTVTGTEALAGERVIGGNVWGGFSRVVRSGYFLQIALNMLFFTVLTTFLYFQQAAIVDSAFTDRAMRTAFFARIDLTVNVITLFTQAFLTGRLVKTIGLAPSLAFLPVLSVVGFIALGITPTIVVLMAFQVLRRAGNFSIARPAREVLFTVVSREDRYKAKSFIDTFVYRAGDQVGAWSFALLGAIGIGIGGVSIVAVVLALLSIVNALWLGWRQERMLRERLVLDGTQLRTGAGTSGGSSVASVEI
jgi:AAA family ATP:ADP antiporter